MSSLSRRIWQFDHWVHARAAPIPCTRRILVLCNHNLNNSDKMPNKLFFFFGIYCNCVFDGQIKKAWAKLPTSHQWIFFWLISFGILCKWVGCKKKSPELLHSYMAASHNGDSPSPPSVTLLSRVWGCQYQLQKKSGPPLSIAFHYIYMDDGLMQWTKAS
jgi:hypothetical protein